MKELNDFRKFLNEDLDEGVMDKLKKFGKKVKDVADKMEQGEDDEKGVFAALSKKKTQEGEIHEGTWSLGSVERMEKLIDVLTAISQNDNLGLMKAQLEKLESPLYRVFGDDDFSDKKDAAMRHLEDGDLDRFRNSMSDAIDRAKDMLAYQKGSENLEENDVTLDEVSESMGIFKEIDEMVGRIKEQMDPDDAFNSLVSEFEAISGGTKLLHRALMNISLDNNL